MSSAVFAQETENNDRKEKPKSVLFDEFGKISQKEMKLRTEKLRKKLLEKDSINEGLRAFLIFYTDEKTTTLRNEQNLITEILLPEDCRDCYGLGGPYILFVDGGKSKEQKIQFWLSPRGAEPPTP